MAKEQEYTDAGLPKRDKAAGHAKIDKTRRLEAKGLSGGWYVGGVGRPSHPDGWQTGGR